MISDKVATILVGVLYLATLYVLVKPNSQGPALVNTVLTTFSDLVRGVSGQTYNTQTQLWQTGS